METFEITTVKDLLGVLSGLPPNKGLRFVDGTGKMSTISAAVVSDEQDDNVLLCHKFILTLGSKRENK